MAFKYSSKSSSTVFESCAIVSIKSFSNPEVGRYIVMWMEVTHPGGLNTIGRIVGLLVGYSFT